MPTPKPLRLLYFCKNANSVKSHTVFSLISGYDILPSRRSQKSNATLRFATSF